MFSYGPIRNLRPTRGLRRLGLFTAGLAFLPLLAAPSTADDRSAPIFQPLGVLPRVAADIVPMLQENLNEFQLEQVLANKDESAGTGLIIPESRQIWQFYTGVAGRFVVIRDADDLTVRRTLLLPGEFRSAWHAGPTLLYAMEPGRRIFFYRTGLEGQSIADPEAVVAVDLRDFTMREYAVPRIPATALGGMTYDPLQDRLLLLYNSPSQIFVTASVSVVTVSLDTAAVSAPRPVRSCESGLSSTEAFGVASQNLFFTDESYIYLHCLRAGNVSTIVRLPVTGATSSTSSEEFTTGPTNGHTAILDGFSGRVFNATDQGAIWVFDTKTMAYVGTVAAHPDGGESNPALSYGVDPSSGRLYFQAPQFGLGVVEGRLFPVPQGRSDSQLAAQGNAPILVDPPTGRVFVLPRGADGYRIYRQPDEVADAPPFDPDIGTIDQAEVPGATQSSFSASASGYGARVLMTKGVIPLFPMPGAGGGPANPGYVFTKNLTTACSFTDRDLFVGRVAKTEADTGSTAAAAIAADIDPRSKLDLEQPSRCDASLQNDDGSTGLKKIFGTVPGAYGALDGQLGTRTRWNRDPASCSSSLGDEPKPGAPNDGGSPPLGTSQVVCAVPDGERAVAARAEGSLTGDAISVGRSLSWTQIKREERGIVSTAHALASDIEIGGLIRIAEVRSQATSVANGRPGTKPLSEHAVSISGLRIGSTVVCAGPCDLKQATDALNLVAAGRVQFRVGTGAADPGLQAGSPKGALTAVQKSPERQFSDRALAGDDTSEIPGLEMIRYNDNFPWGAARQVFQFAGVATSANYNILLLPQGSPLPPAADPVALPEVEVPGEVVPGTPPTEGTPGTEDIPGTEGTEGTPGTEGTAATSGFSPGSPGTPGTPPTTRIVPVGSSLPTEGVAVAEPADSTLGAVGGAVTDVLSGIGKGLRLVWGNPRQALLLFTAWLLLAQPFLLARRRRLLLRVQSL